MDDFGVVVPGIARVALALPSVCGATQHLVSFGQGLSMVKLLVHVMHTQGETALTNIRVTVDEDIVVRPILLHISILDSAWNVCVSYSLEEGWGDARLILTVPVRDVVDSLETLIVKNCDFLV